MSVSKLGTIKPFLKVGDVINGNYSEFETDGTLKFNGAATVWDDLRFVLTKDKQGQSDKPDYDFTLMGLLFPQNDATEIAYVTAQFPHSEKLGNTLKPHIHWLQTGAATAKWFIDYRAYNNNTGIPGGFTTLALDTEEFTYPGSGSIIQISEADIDTSGFSFTTDISWFMDIKLYRNDNDMSGDALAKEFDIHFEKGTVGSRQEFTK